MGSIGAPELLIILILVLLVFGGTKLPKLARSLGQAQREFKTGLSESESDQADGGTGSGNAKSSDGDRSSGGGKPSTNGAG